MAAPLAAKAALALGPKTLLRVAGAGFAILLGLAMTPLLLIFGLAAVAVPPAGAGDPNGPMIVGEWGKPQAPGYDYRRGYGLGGDGGCAICGRFHNGVDIGSGCGSAIYAIGPGVVKLTDSLPEYGYVVVVQHGGGVESWYAHMAPDTFTVVAGQPVTAGSQLGAEGTTGRSTGCHLHLEVRINGTRVDPELFLAQRGITF